MSLKMNLYDPAICEGHLCIKDCDACPWAQDVMEKQADEAYSLDEIIDEVRSW